MIRIYPKASETEAGCILPQIVAVVWHVKQNFYVFVKRLALFKFKARYLHFDRLSQAIFHTY